MPKTQSILNGSLKPQVEIAQLRQSLRCALEDKWFNIWIERWKWNGLDTYEQKKFIMKTLWSKGVIGCRPVPSIDLKVFAPFTPERWNLYDYPSTGRLLNKRNASKVLIPNKSLVVNKDVCLIYAQPNHKPIKNQLDWLIDRIVDIELLINQNLILNSIPFLIGVGEDDKPKLEEIFQKIYAKVPVVYTSIEDLQKFQAIVTNAPYLCDKLFQLEQVYVNTIETILGIDNAGESVAKMAQQLVDQVNANNMDININGDVIFNTIKDCVENANEVFGWNLSVENPYKPVESQHDYESQDIQEQKAESKNE